MRSCCEGIAEEAAAIRQARGRVLWIVLGINALMFGVEFGAGLLARSTSLLADSLDMLGDALVYGFSLFALDRGAHWRNRAALLKGLVMVGFGAGVLTEAAHKAWLEVLPHAAMMGVVGGLALAANLVCAVLLWRHRHDDLNMRSTWICSRNDLLGNLGVLVAAGLTMLWATYWPDVLIGSAIACLFVSSGVSVLRQLRFSRLQFG